MILENLSVIVCSWRRASELVTCLDSLHRQTVAPGEVLVVGVEGDVPTKQVVDEYKAKMPTVHAAWQQGKLGLGNARNLGWLSAKGEWVAFVDDDATADRGWIENLGRHLDGESAALAGQVIDQDTGRVVIDGTFPFQLGAVHRCPAGCNMVFRRAWLERVGGFDEHLIYGYDDYEIGVKLTRSHAKITEVRDAIVRHRRSWGQERPGEGPDLPRYAWSGAYVRAKYFRRLGLTIPEYAVSFSRLLFELVSIRHGTRTSLARSKRWNPAIILKDGAAVARQLASGTIRGLKASKDLP